MKNDVKRSQTVKRDKIHRINQRKLFIGFLKQYCIYINVFLRITHEKKLKFVFVYFSEIDMLNDKCPRRPCTSYWS